jgi:hypothetical protein
MRVLLFFISIFLSCHLFSQSWPIGSIITVCEGETVTIRAQMPGATSHLWSTGATTCTITVTPTITTTYIVQIVINGQTIVDSSTVYVIQVDAGEMTLFVPVKLHFCMQREDFFIGGILKQVYLIRQVILFL